MTQAGKDIYLIANWKSNKTAIEAREFIQSSSIPALSPHTHVVICPPFPYLIPLHEEINNKNVDVELGTQDISPFPFGAYTGAVTCGMTKLFADYSIVGHSERRKYFHETNQEVGNKSREALANSMTPIVCVDVPYLEAQLAFFTADEMKKIIIAYEPLSAIGSGTPDTPVHANEIGLKIQQLAGVSVPVLYGGSVTSKTVRGFLDQPAINGVLVGGASLDPKSWSSLVKAAIAY